MLLLRRVKGLCCRFDAAKQNVRAITMADKAIMLFFQSNKMSNTVYYEEFNACVESVESYGSSIGLSKGLIKSELTVPMANATAAMKQQARTTAKEKYLAMLMLDGANAKRFSSLKANLDNDFAKGVDTYPTNRNAVLRLLTSWNDMVQERHGTEVKDEDHQNMFVLDDEMKQKCYVCGSTEHLKANCPNCKDPADKKDKEKPADSDEEQMHAMTECDSNDESDGSYGVEDEVDAADGDKDVFFFAQVTDIESREEEVVLTQPKIRGLNKDWLLLDSQSLTDMFCNSDYLSHFEDAERPTIIHCNARTSKCTKVAQFDIPLFGRIPVKYYPEGICNVIFLKTMGKLFKVTYDSENRSCFKVHTPSGVAVFKQCKKGLHYLDMSKLDQDTLCFVTTIKDQFKGYTKKEVVNAIKLFV
jgi:hypothetical protein